MAKITVEQLAKVVGISTDRLLEQIKKAGINIKSVDGVIDGEQRRVLLEYLQKNRSDHKKNSNNSTLKLSVSSKDVQQQESYESDSVSVITLRKKRQVTTNDFGEKYSSEKQDIVDVASPIEAVEETEKVKIEEKGKIEEDKSNSEKTERTKERKQKSLKSEVEVKKSSSIRKKVSRRVSVLNPKKRETKNEFSRKIPKSIVQSFEKPVAPVSKEVFIPEIITVYDLALRISVKSSEVIKAMMKMGFMATINQVIDQDTAILVAEELGHKAYPMKENEPEAYLEISRTEEFEKIGRPPVVTIMGHVDHGKTSLLDCIRRTKVALGESGGITQHIGAYHVTTDKGVITFLDTPGHEAFTAMRARGAKCTDIVVLVVAADDGVMPQTVEAIQHSKAANVPMIVAVNKVDKPEADPENIRTALSNYNVISEKWGGDVMFVDISARTGQGIDTLLDSILTLSEMLELKAPLDSPAKGVIIESHLDKSRGSVATVLVQSGVLHKGDIILAGLYSGRIRSMLDDSGKNVKEVTPSMPVEVFGLSGTPNVGSDVVVVDNEKKAREIALFRQGKYREIKLARQKPSSLVDILDEMKSDTRVLNIVLKADVQGSVEAITGVLEKLSKEDIQVKVITGAAGSISSSDVNLSLASKAIIIGFNVRADSAARRLADQEGVEIRYYNVIYDLVSDIEAALSGMVAPKIQDKILGLAEVREIFRSSKFGVIAGCKVVEGVVKRRLLRILRDSLVIYDGELSSLKRFKEDVNEVKNGIIGIGMKIISILNS